MTRLLILAACLLSLCGCGASPGERRHIARDQAFFREHPLPPLALEPRPGHFVLAVLPDTQYYSENNHQARSLFRTTRRYDNLSYDPVMAFFAQTHWLAQNATALQIPLVVHLGDVVQNASSLIQWRVASSAMRLLEEGGVPYSIMTGARDIQGELPGDDHRSVRDHFDEFFGPQRATWQSTYAGSDPLGLSQYHRFRAGDQDFLLLALDCNPSDATLAWAQRVLDEHPNTPVILASHGITLPPNGEARLWDKLIRRNDQIFLTLSSQLNGSSHRRLSNDHGLSVDMLQFDYQMQYLGGNGLLRLLEFDLAGNRIEALTMSPWVLWKSRYLPAATRACSDASSLSDCDQLAPRPAEQKGWDNRYSIEVDFRQRFSAFAGYRQVAQDVPAEDGLLSQLRRSLNIE